MKSPSLESPMGREKIEDLLSRWQLPARAAAPLIALVQTLAADPHAPTAVRSPDAIVDEHLADSLTALELPEVRRAKVVADLGSGGGFPGLPLAIALPTARVFLVESNARKCAYIARAAAASQVANAAVVNRRAEEWREGFGRQDLVTARALAPLPVVLEYAAPLLRLGGTLVAWRGRRDPDAEHDTKAAALELGLEVAEPIHVVPYSGAQHRFLHPFSKSAETPARFPRRPGSALKRPLGVARVRSA